MKRHTLTQVDEARKAVSLLKATGLQSREQIQLKMTKNFTEIKCNPLDMIVGGIVNEQEASKTFTDRRKETSGRVL